MHVLRRPSESIVSTEQVAIVALTLAEMNCAEISLGDTIGIATPG